MADVEKTNVPIPDPSTLTTAALLREIDHLRELIMRTLAERDHRYQQRFEDQSLALNFAREAAEKAVSKAEVAAEKRYDSLNDKVDDHKNATAGLIAAMQSQLAAMSGKSAGGAAVWAYLVGAVGLIIGVVTFANSF